MRTEERMPYEDILFSLRFVLFFRCRVIFPPNHSCFYQQFQLLCKAKNTVHYATAELDSMRVSDTRYSGC